MKIGEKKMSRSGQREDVKELIYWSWLSPLSFSRIDPMFSDTAWVFLMWLEPEASIWSVCLKSGRWTGRNSTELVCTLVSPGPVPPMCSNNNVWVYVWLAGIWRSWALCPALWCVSEGLCLILIPDGLSDGLILTLALVLGCICDRPNIIFYLSDQTKEHGFLLYVPFASSTWVIRFLLPPLHICFGHDVHLASSQVDKLKWSAMGLFLVH